MTFKVCYLVRFLGYYHGPRLKRLSDDIEPLGGSLKIAQFQPHSDLYSHAQPRRLEFFKTLNVTEFASPKGLALVSSILSFLNTENPDYIFVLGYSDPIAFTALMFAHLNKAKIYFMGDSKADDQPRRRSTEFVKKQIIRRFDGALVAGEKHRQYFKSLGLNKTIELGFDVVDNEYYASNAKRFLKKNSILRKYNILPEKYVLCVSRLIEKKRVDRVLNIYAASGIATCGYKLVLIGDGPELSKLMSLVEAQNLQGNIIHIGSVKSHLMPAFYSAATAIILASEFDQWGLCINEAMACGVPAIVSSRCGVANEIVNNETGVVFDGDDLTPAVDGLKQMVSDPNYAAGLSASCLLEVSKWDLNRFSAGAINLMLASKTRK